mmetsp:Transcript_5991/g.13273  ORF Transcript_5991/g.13273 Transcript_5991/m.13273 type:complete len:83 (+) Transcript_5991:297-545(+)|eukprot:CAMPEP_0172181882 /NCGR_PEP_ID=MMETSP1050-20130122/18078_1 /TAXON_ID=233186 /ORGANISM="Cryptomonas curvata, Strain CCAP979/52" /LENGTH=82 /DNA_ID=CAMNT_0012855241 /DNA_START=296 /DNA_END=544 /DNA_ORIENTATION=-
MCGSAKLDIGFGRQMTSIPVGATKFPANAGRNDADASNGRGTAGWQIGEHLDGELAASDIDADSQSCRASAAKADSDSEDAE